jgi:hypothetical protein
MRYVHGLAVLLALLVATAPVSSPAGALVRGAERLYEIGPRHRYSRTYPSDSISRSQWEAARKALRESGTPASSIGIDAVLDLISKGQLEAATQVLREASEPADSPTGRDAVPRHSYSRQYHSKRQWEEAAEEALRKISETPDLDAVPRHRYADLYQSGLISERLLREAATQAPREASEPSDSSTGRDAVPFPVTPGVGVNRVNPQTEVSRLRKSGRSLFIEHVPQYISAAYLLIDASGRVFFSGDDHAELAKKLNERLSNFPDHSIYVEMIGFSDDKAAALITSLRIQQRQIDKSIRVLPHFAEDRGPTQNLFTRGIRLERALLLVDPRNDGSGYSADFTFRVGFPRRFQKVYIRVVSATLDLTREAVRRIKQLVPSKHFDKRQSLSEVVDRLRRELKMRHEGLTDQQLKVDMIGQFGNIRTVKRLPSRAFAWS